MMNSCFIIDFGLREREKFRFSIFILRHSRNVVEKQLNSVAKTVNYKQLILYAIVRVLIIHETIYDFSSKFIIELIKILQQEDEFAVKLKADEMMNI